MRQRLIMMSYLTLSNCQEVDESLLARSWIKSYLLVLNSCLHVLLISSLEQLSV